MFLFYLKKKLKSYFELNIFININIFSKVFKNRFLKTLQNSTYTNIKVWGVKTCSFFQKAKTLLTSYDVKIIDQKDTIISKILDDFYVISKRVDNDENKLFDEFEDIILRYYTTIKSKLNKNPAALIEIGTVNARLKLERSMLD